MMNVLQAYPCMLGHLVTIGTNSVLIPWKIFQDTAFFIWNEILVKVYGVFVEHVVIDFLHVGELVWDDDDEYGISYRTPLCWECSLCRVLEYTSKYGGMRNSG